MNKKIDRDKQINKQSIGAHNLKINIYTIDQAVSNFVKNVIQPNVQYQNQTVSVPLIYADGQKWAYAKKYQLTRDKNGQILSPVIIFKRDDISKRQHLQFPKLNLQNPVFSYVVKSGVSPESTISIKQPIRKYRDWETI